MVAEVFAGIGAFKAMFDLAKGMKDINDATVRNGAVIELQSQILAAQMAQAELIQKVGDLEKEVATFEKWETEKANYELKTVAHGAIAYMLKTDSRGSEPPHWLCTNCYENRKKSIIQAIAQMGRDLIFKCPACANTFQTHGDVPIWIDPK